MSIKENERGLATTELLKEKDSKYESLAEKYQNLLKENQEHEVQATNMKSQIAKLQTGLLELQNKNSVLINKVKTNNSSQSAIEELTQANKRIEDCME